jgi:hypothetical protein
LGRVDVRREKRGIGMGKQKQKISKGEGEAGKRWMGATGRQSFGEEEWMSG